MGDDRFLNWDNSKRNPYRIPNIVFHEGEVNWKILTPEEQEKYLKLETRDSSRIFIPGSYKLHEIVRLTDIGTLDLLGGFFDETYEDGTTEKLWIDDLGYFPNFFVDDHSKPIFVFATYPFMKAVEIEISPYSFTRISENNEKFHAQSKIGVGYILWQISKAYKDIYKNHWKETGVWGHEFMDLSFYSVNFFKGNKVLIQLES